jgi:group I intron endonuclease
MGCLYRISFPSGKSYIGITMHTALGRFAEHCYEATRDNDRALKRALRKYGKDSATLETLAISNDWGYLTDIERRAIKVFGTFGHGGYNMTVGGDGSLGYKHTPESLAKMGVTHKGKAHHNMPHSEEAKAKMSAARMGIKLSEETKRKIGEASKGNKHCLGVKHSEETKKKRLMAIRGKARKTGTSGHVGVSFCKRTNKWRAHLTLNWKMIDLGRYEKISDAISARKNGERQFFAEGAQHGY